MFRIIKNTFIALAILSSSLFGQFIRHPIQSVVPSMNATGIERESPVAVTFTTPMTVSSMNAASIFLYGEKSGKHSGAIHYDENTKTVSLQSSKKFLYGEQLQFVITDSVGTADPYTKITGGFGLKFLTGVLQGTGTFSSQSQSLMTPSSPRAIAAADVDGDGFTDIAVSQKNSASIALFRNNHRNGFFPAGEYSAEQEPEALAFADISGDGFPDIIVANRASKSISILNNNGNGTFSSNHFSVSVDPAALAVADCNNDGVLDIAVVSPTDSSFYIFQFKNSQLQSTNKVHLAGIPSGVALEDFNNDGYIDGAVSVRSRNRLALLKNDSTGKFTFDKFFTVGTTPEAVIAYDAVLGSDGYVDLATINSGTNNISILKNDKSGSFQGPEHFDINGTEPVAICGNDFDGDGDVDLAIANRGSKSISILRNMGEALPEITSVTLSAEPFSIITLDITGAYGILDLMVTHPLVGTISTIRNSFISPPPPEVIISIDSIIFPNTAVSDSSISELRVYSMLTATVIDSIKFTSAHFSSTIKFPQTLASYDSIVMGLVYHPLNYGIHIDSAKIYSPSGVITIKVRGESPLPLLTTSTKAHHFGSVKIIDTSSTILYASNKSINTIRIDSISVRNRAFSVPSNPTPIYLLSNDSLPITIRFAPDVAGQYLDTLKIYCSPQQSSAIILLDGTGTPVDGVERISSVIPDKFVLEQNYPNPFNPGTTIRYSIPEAAYVSIKVFDLVGRETASIVEQVQSAGHYSVYWNAERFSSGMYFYRLTARSEASSKNIVLLKKLSMIK